MINLLPYEEKKQLKAARSNSSLIKYLFLLIFAAVFLSGICVTFYFILENSRPAPITTSTTVSTSSAQSDSTSGYNQARIQATQINNDFQNDKAILDKQVSYSAIIIAIGQALPDGTKISDLEINSSSIDSGINLKIFAKTSDVQKTIKDNFSKSSILSNFNLKSVESGQSNPSGYPVTINATVSVNRNYAK